MRELHSAGWLAQWPLGYFVLDREAVEFFLRSKKVTFPGLEMAELFGVTEGPLFEEISRNILSLNGEDHRRLRNLVNPAFAPRAVERYRPAMRSFLEKLTGAFADDLLERRRHDVGDDLISTLIAARYEGDRLSDTELVNLVLNVLVGGVDTTQSQLAHTVRLLAQHPDQWQVLADQPDLASRAVDEALRYEPITPFTARIVLEEIEYRDVTFPAGTIIMVSAWNANHDGVVYEQPERFDIAAERAAKPLTFGAGIH